jgi:hypothetical protein
MSVDIVYPISIFSRQARSVEIVNIAYFAVEEIESFETEPQSFLELVADAAIDERRGTGTNAVVFDQRARSEVA